MLSGPRPDSDEPRREILERSPGWWATPLLNRVPRWLLTAVAGALLAGGGAVLVASQTRHPPARIAPVVNTAPIPAGCVPFINLSGVRASTGYRIIFGDAAVPPGYLGPQFSAQSGSRTWRYDWKVGFGFRGGGLPVTISVPMTWRNHLALFGPSADGYGYTSRLHLPGCPPKGVWNTYVSSFFLRTPSACVPLQVQVGRRTATVWFGLARHCPAVLLTGRG